MEEVNLLILRHLRKDYVEKVSNVDSRLRIFDRSDSERLGNYLPVHKDEVAEDYSKAEIILAYRTPPNLLKLAPNLKWLQLSSAGFEHLDESTLKSHIRITNASGIHGTAIAEHIAMIMLMFSRKALNLFEWKKDRLWSSFVPEEIRGRTLGIIGLGHIGLEVLDIAKALGMKILVTDIIFSTVTKGVAGIEVIYPTSFMKEMLSKSDFVVVAVPQKKETEGLIGENELRVMKRSAYIINISRGPIIDERAMVKALEEGWIAGAGLDVFEKEPLPTESKLWAFPNVIISPHIAGVSDQHDKRLTDLFCENIVRYLNRESLLNVVN